MIITGRQVVPVQVEVSPEEIAASFFRMLELSIGADLKSGESLIIEGGKVRRSWWQNEYHDQCYQHAQVIGPPKGMTLEVQLEKASAILAIHRSYNASFGKVIDSRS